MQDLYGRVGVVQVHPVFEELFHAFDTRPTCSRENGVRDEKETFRIVGIVLLAYSFS